MTVLCDIKHETGDLSEYDSTVTDGGDLSVAAAAALASTAYGLSCVIDDTTSIYGQKNLTATSQLRYRYHINPNSLTMADGDTFDVVEIIRSGAPWVLLVNALGRSGSDYQISLLLF